MRDDDRLSKC